MLKKFILSLFFFSFGLYAHSQSLNLQDLRGKYLLALADYEEAPQVYSIFLSVDNPSAQVLAYKGALEAIMTKTTWNVLRKLSYLRKSSQSFEQAVKLEPNNLEVRFMRMAVQYEIPEYLGFSDDMERDRKFIVEHIDEFNPTGISSETLKQIYGFMVKCERFTDSQIETFKGYLALK